MSNETKAALATATLVAALAYSLHAVKAWSQDPEAPEPTWIVIDGSAVGTLGADGLEYDLDQNVIRIQTVETVYGCSADLIFRDRYQGGAQ